MDFRKRIFSILIIVGMAAFDLYNFATSNYALASFGDISLKIASFTLRTSTALAIAFCVVDFAGISSIFTEEKWPNEPLYVWLLTGGWLVASIVNAMLTWWANVLVIRESSSLANLVFPPEKVITIVPLIMAISVFLVRILLIGSIVLAGNSTSRAAKPKWMGLFKHPGITSAKPVQQKSNPISPIQRPVYHSSSSAVRPKAETQKPDDGKVRVQEIDLGDLLK